MSYDFKAEYKEYYSAKAGAQIVILPSFRYLSIEGKGRVSASNEAYREASTLLHQTASNLKNSAKLGRVISGAFDYVLPPIEVLTLQDEVKKTWSWRLISRIPDFIQAADIEWAKDLASSKLGIDASTVCAIHFSEGMCAQLMHTGPASGKAEAYGRIATYLSSFGYRVDTTRHTHEIPLSDPKRASRNSFRTVLRVPIC